MNKKLIVFFSYTNNTRMIVNKLSDQIAADVVEIKTVIPYSDDYETVVNDEHNSEASNYLPEISYRDIDLKLYDIVIIGTPVWWYRPVPAIRSFLKQNDLANKFIIPFATNAGWLGKTFDEMKAMCPDSIIQNEMNIVFESYSDKLITDESDIDAWIASINS